MKSLVSKIKPTLGFAPVVHIGLSALLPVLMFVFVRIDLGQVALAVVLLSKWRMLAVRPRHWWPHIRANAVDIIVGLSTLTFMLNSQAITWQLTWAVAYGIWLTIVKPRTDILGVSLQAFVGYIFGLSALFVIWKDAPLAGLVIGTWFVAYMSARHFFTNFEEPYTPLYSHFWGYFAATLTWILGHYLLFYNVLSQPTVLLTVIGYGMGALYYLDHKDRLSVFMRRQFVFIMVAIVFIVVTFADWSDKAI
ncbi:hypothetical protein BH23PAT2_BH23PAT2_07490 [soil metagenome]